MPVGPDPSIECGAFPRGRIPRDDPFYVVPVYRVVTTGMAMRLVVQSRASGPVLINRYN